MALTFRAVTFTSHDQLMVSSWCLSLALLKSCPMRSIRCWVHYNNGRSLHLPSQSSDAHSSAIWKDLTAVCVSVHQTIIHKSIIAASTAAALTFPLVVFWSMWDLIPPFGTSKTHVILAHWTGLAGISQVCHPLVGVINRWFDLYWWSIRWSELM